MEIIRITKTIRVTPHSKNISKPRRCLRCDEMFTSSGISNRICRPCKDGINKYDIPGYLDNIYRVLIDNHIN